MYFSENAIPFLWISTRYWQPGSNFVEEAIHDLVKVGKKHQLVAAKGAVTRMASTGCFSQPADCKTSKHWPGA
jgi:hypothetical protein